MSLLVQNKIDLAILDEVASQEYLVFENYLRKESSPDDPPRTIEGFVAQRRNMPPATEVHTWEVRDTALEGNPIIGMAELHIGHYQTNQNLADFGIHVLPERRREGIARQLLQGVTLLALEKGRTRLLCSSIDRVPAGVAFLKSIGAEPGLESHTNQLTLAEVDRTFLREYREESVRRGKGEFQLERYDSPIPEELLEPIVELANVVAGDVPHGELDIEPPHLTADEIRAMDQANIASGAKNLVLLARERGGKLVGMTMLTWRKHTPYFVYQGITGVLKEYRGNGIARALKATLLEQLMDEYPEVNFVRTDNADSNAGMLAINRALGFRPYRATTNWQVATEQALASTEGVH